MEVTPVTHDELTLRNNSGESSSDIRARVIKARKVQEDRYQETPGIFSNAMLPSNRVHEYYNQSPLSTE